jgi:hypothetical protein
VAQNEEGQLTLTRDHTPNPNPTNTTNSWKHEGEAGCYKCFSLLFFLSQ